MVFDIYFFLYVVASVLTTFSAFFCVWALVHRMYWQDYLQKLIVFDNVSLLLVIIVRDVQFFIVKYDTTHKLPIQEACSFVKYFELFFMNCNYTCNATIVLAFVTICSCVRRGRPPVIQKTFNHCRIFFIVGMVVTNSMSVLSVLSVQRKFEPLLSSYCEFGVSKHLNLYPLGYLVGTFFSIVLPAMCGVFFMAYGFCYFKPTGHVPHYWAHYHGVYGWFSCILIVLSIPCFIPNIKNYVTLIRVLCNDFQSVFFAVVLYVYLFKSKNKRNNHPLYASVSALSSSVFTEIQSISHSPSRNASSLVTSKASLKSSSRSGRVSSGISSARISSGRISSARISSGRISSGKSVYSDANEFNQPLLYKRHGSDEVAVRGQVPPGDEVTIRSQGSPPDEVTVRSQVPTPDEVTVRSQVSPPNEGTKVLANS